MTQHPTPEAPLAWLGKQRELLTNVVRGPWVFTDCEGELNVLPADTLKDVVYEGGDEGNVRAIESYTFPATYGTAEMIVDVEVESWDPGESEWDDIRRANFEWIARARSAHPIMVDLLTEVIRVLTDLEAVSRTDAGRPEDPTDAAYFDGANAGYQTAHDQVMRALAAGIRRGEARHGKA